MLYLAQLLPESWQPRAKAVIGVLGLILTVVAGTLDAVPVWLTILLGVLTALGVHQTPAPGYDAPPLKARKGSDGVYAVDDEPQP